MPPHIRELAEAEIRNASGRLVQVIDDLLVTTYNHGGAIALVAGLTASSGLWVLRDMPAEPRADRPMRVWRA